MAAYDMKDARDVRRECLELACNCRLASDQDGDPEWSVRAAALSADFVGAPGGDPHDKLRYLYLARNIGAAAESGDPEDMIRVAERLAGVVDGPDGAPVSLAA